MARSNHCETGIVPKSTIGSPENKWAISPVLNTSYVYIMLLMLVTMVSRLFASRWCLICHPAPLQNAM
jgi:hypothetical protein